MIKNILESKSALVLLLLFFLFYSCQSNEESSKSKIKKSLDIFQQLNAYEDSILSSGQIATSLKYEKENGSTYQVSAHLNPNNEILMLEEKISENNNQFLQANYFYIQKGALYASKELTQHNKDSLNEEKYTERIVFYDKEKVSKAYEKTSSKESTISQLDYTQINSKGLSFEKAKHCLNQEGEFITTFQGFVFHNNMVYIVVGGLGDDSYSSALRVNNKDDLVLFLMKDQKKYLNRKLKIIFENIDEQNGYSYQSYIQGTFSD
ncbi:MAG: hypothetical protein HYU67_06665 [Flavobacteriia bacterium]|nr:hypothetical protein [Flavobacteriia bacterium]